MFAKDFDRFTRCPFDHVPESSGMCAMSDCALWHKSTNAEYSSCVFEALAHDMDTISFALAQGNR